MIVNGYEIKSNANLEGADLYGANLYGADLRLANLRNANLYGANLHGADLYRADLYGANLSGANFSDAYLRLANLRNANLRGADLRNADLRGADLRNADLRGATLPDFQIPQGVGITVYKKLSHGKVAELFIPENAKRTAVLTSNKCRAEFALVVSIDGDTTPGVAWRGWHDKHFIYTVGKVVHPDKYDDDIRLECTNGIHFFMTREEAENW